MIGGIDVLRILQHADSKHVVAATGRGGRYKIVIPPDPKV